MTRREELENTMEELEGITERHKEQLTNVIEELNRLTAQEDTLLNITLPNQPYYYVDVDIDGNLVVRSYINRENSYSRNILYSGRGFRTRKEAEDEIRRITVRAKLEKVARSGNRNKKLIMCAEQALYYIFYNTFTCELAQQEIEFRSMPAGTIVCEDDNFLEEALKVISRKDLEWFCQNEQ